MKILEQILQEIDKKIEEVEKIIVYPPADSLDKATNDTAEAFIGAYKGCQSIIRSHMEDDGWIPVEERLPENSKYKGAFCPKYRVLTKYGETVGWYNPDFESWYVLIWFMADRFLETEIDVERGDVPKLVRAPLETKIVTAWRPRED